MSDALADLLQIGTTRRRRTRVVRDPQRSKVYKAEDRWRDAGHRGREFASVAEMQAYVDKLTHSAWWKRTFPKAQRIEVHPGYGHRSASAQLGLSIAKLQMPLWSRRESVLLHEVAHVASNFDHHNWSFCAAYLKLVQHKMGKDAARQLKDEYRKGRVKYRAPIKRNLTDEQREVLRRRAASMRAAKAARERPS